MFGPVRYVKVITSLKRLVAKHTDRSRLYIMGLGVPRRRSSSDGVRSRTEGSPSCVDDMKERSIYVGGNVPMIGAPEYNDQTDGAHPSWQGRSVD